MRPDLSQLRHLIEASPGFGRAPAAALPEPALRAAEARTGPLPVSYRWWLSAFGHGRAGGAEIATLAPETDTDTDELYEDITAGWRRTGTRLCFAVEPDCGESYFFALDRRGDAGDGEHPVVRRDGLDGEEYPVAESFAGFLAVAAARSRGLGDGPNPTVARLWRSTPGALLGNGVLIYGPHLVQERNRTFGMARRAPGWVLIGDDGEGGGLLMRHHGRDRTTVYRQDLGTLGDRIGPPGTGAEPLTDDLIGWMDAARSGSTPAGA
ncbi:SMI1/KNR4 family protein [Streptomyces sp. NPDC001985]|uniref:SMI1/KNR4 family protein n=1 Tax=Streptomyces sp. NPDC001985 TaxID=3154406 RepID=UPI00332EA84F